MDQTDPRVNRCLAVAERAVPKSPSNEIALYRYRDGALCVEFHFRESWWRLSCNIGSFSLGLAPDCFAVKHWSENQEMARAAFASGLFEDTGERKRTGYCEAPVWRIKGLVG